MAGVPGNCKDNVHAIAAVDATVSLNMTSSRRSRPLLAVPPAVAGHADARAGGIIDLAGIAVEIQRTPVLRGLDLTLAPGQITGITGANGSGKTTLLQLVATLHRPTAGVGCVLGADLFGVASADVRRRICLVGHDAAMYPQLTLRENLQFVAAMYGTPPQAADAALDVVGLGRAADRRAGRCSNGMLRRADLARALMGRPKLLLLDEPHAGLDSSSADLVEFLIADVRGRGGAALIVSHDRPRLAQFADDIVELSDGRLVPDKALP